jgi:hypothetical protein
VVGERGKVATGRIALVCGAVVGRLMARFCYRRLAKVKIISAPRLFLYQTGENVIFAGIGSGGEFAAWASGTPALPGKRNCPDFKRMAG